MLDRTRYYPTCQEKVNDISIDERYRMIEAPETSLKEFYEMNNVSQYYKKKLNKEQLEKYYETDSHRNVWVMNNYRWEPYCEIHQITRENSMRIFSSFLVLIDFINIIIIMTGIQAFILFFLLVVIFYPWFKAFCLCRICLNKKDYIQIEYPKTKLVTIFELNLERRVQNGDYLLLVSLKKFLNTLLNCI